MFIEYLEYCQRWRQILEARGMKFTVHNPDNLSIKETDATVAFADLVDRTKTLEEELLTGKSGNPNYRPLLNKLLDRGSHIRYEGLFFANWVTSENSRGNDLPTDEVWFKHDVTGIQLLTRAGVLRRDDASGMWVWVNGQPPALNSQEFNNAFELFEQNNQLLPRTF